MKRDIAGLLLFLLLTSSVIMLSPAVQSAAAQEKKISARKSSAEIGQYLAKWSNIYHKTITINGRPINIEGPNAGGYSEVHWQLPLGMAATPEEVAYIKGKNRTVRRNLRILIKQGSCDVTAIRTY